MTPDPDNLLTLAEAAARLRIDNPRTLRACRYAWGIPAFKVGRELRFREGDLDAWIRDRAEADLLAEAVRRTVAFAPRLSTAQRDELRALLDPVAS